MVEVGSEQEFHYVVGLASPSTSDDLSTLPTDWLSNLDELRRLLRETLAKYDVHPDESTFGIHSVLDHRSEWA